MAKRNAKAMPTPTPRLTIVQATTGAIQIAPNCRSPLAGHYESGPRPARIPPLACISMCDVFPTEFAGPAACPRSGQPRCPGWCPCGNIIRGIAPCTTMFTSRHAGPIRDISGEDPTRHSTGLCIWRFRNTKQDMIPMANPRSSNHQRPAALVLGLNNVKMRCRREHQIDE